MYCTKCGARLEKDARFCTACGTPVELAEPSAGKGLYHLSSPHCQPRILGILKRRKMVCGVVYCRRYCPCHCHQVLLLFVVGMAGHHKKLNNAPAESSAMSGSSAADFDESESSETAANPESAVSSESTVPKDSSSESMETQAGGDGESVLKNPEALPPDFNFSDSEWETLTYTGAWLAETLDDGRLDQGEPYSVSKMSLEDLGSYAKAVLQKFTATVNSFRETKRLRLL